jgi:hypothetical protein
MHLRVEGARMLTLPKLPSPSHHWVFPHHGQKLGHESFLDVLTTLEWYGGQHIGSQTSVARTMLDAELGRILTENTRTDTGASNPFRDYQQLYCHMGVLYPHQIANYELHLTPLAQKLASGSISLSEFLLLQVFGYQYPNGASGGKVIQQYLNDGILVKPFLLIYQVLSELREVADKHGYITEAEIATFLVPQKDNSSKSDVVKAILRLRSPQMGDPTIPVPYPEESRSAYQERKRTVAEMVRVIELLPFFRGTDGPSGRELRLEYPENEQIGAAEMAALADLESKPESLHRFVSADRGSRLEWYSRYGAVERLARWHEQVATLQAISVPPQLQLQPWIAETAGRVSISPAHVQRTPEQTAELQERRLASHIETIERLGKLALSVGATVTYDPRSVDLSIDLEGQRFFIEVKSLASDQSDTVDQIRAAAGQLLEYRYRAQDSTIQLCVALDRFPSAERWIVSMLLSNGFLFCWWDESQEEWNTPPECTPLVAWIQQAPTSPPTG